MIEDCPAAHETIDDGRIRLQPHVLLEPILEHLYNARTLVGATGLLLHNRGKDQSLLRRRDHDVLIALLPDFGEKFRLGSLHALDDVLPRVVLSKFVSVGKQSDLSGELGDIYVKIGLRSHT